MVEHSTGKSIFIDNNRLSPIKTWMVAVEGMAVISSWTPPETYFAANGALTGAAAEGQKYKVT